MPITTLNLESASSDATSRRALSQLSFAVAKSKRIVVVTGAGISCSSGIPDFRSSDGLYNLVKAKYPDVVLKGRDLFDAALFRDATSTAVFYTFISGLKTAIDKAEPSATHHFINTLDKKGRLLRSYTQNIDGLEERAGLSGASIAPPTGEADTAKGKMKAKLSKDMKNVQLHGDIHRVRCTICNATYPCEAEHITVFQRGEAPECPECSSRCNERIARSARALRVGTLRPAIVLYDEPHPLGDDIATVQTADLGKKPDLLIVMGTSLKVHGLKKLVKEFAKAVHQRSAPTAVNSQSNRTKSESSLSSLVDGNVGKVIFVNKTPPSGEWGGVIDYHIEGTTDEWAERVLTDWKKQSPADWEVQTTLTDTNGRGRHRRLKKTFKVVKPVVTLAAKPRAGPSRRNIEAENIPPAKGDTESPTSSPKSKRPLGEKNTETTVDTNAASCSLVKPQIFSASPSKRQSPTSHYEDEDDVECNPRKRTKVVSGLAKGKAVMKDNERGLLFGPSATICKETADSDEEEAQVEPEPPRPMAKAKSQRFIAMPSSGRVKAVLALPQRPKVVLQTETQFRQDDLCSDDGGPPSSRQSSAPLHEGWDEASSEREVDDLLANVSARSALSDNKGGSSRDPICIDL